MADKIKMFKDQIKEIRVDIQSIDRGKAPESGRAALLKLLDEKKSKLKELEMSDKTAKGVDTKDMSTLKKDKTWLYVTDKDSTENLKKKEKKEKLENVKKKDEAEDKRLLPLLKKNLPKAKKLKALNILKKAGFGIKAEVDKDVYMKLQAAEAALKALWSALAEKGDPLTSVEQQRDIEGLLQKISEWHKSFTS